MWISHLEKHKIKSKCYFRSCRLFFSNGKFLILLFSVGWLLFQFRNDWQTCPSNVRPFESSMTTSYWNDLWRSDRGEFFTVGRSVLHGSKLINPAYCGVRQSQTVTSRPLTGTPSTEIMATISSGEFLNSRVRGAAWLSRQPRLSSYPKCIGGMPFLARSDHQAVGSIGSAAASTAQSSTVCVATSAASSDRLFSCGSSRLFSRLVQQRQPRRSLRHCRSLPLVWRARC